jgi:hypothetical protein
LNLDDEAAYAITHALFYLTDFGVRPAPLKAVEMNRVVDLVEGLLLHYWRTGNWDLVGELLVNLNCIDLNCFDRCCSDIYAGAAGAYDAAWRADGALSPRRSNVGGASGDEETFGTCYHPTLVAVLYCATGMNALQRRTRHEAPCTA